LFAQLLAVTGRRKFYQELKRIEQLLIEKIANRRRSASDQLQISFVTPKQFYGMDINPFAVELARVTLMIARKVAIDRFNLTEASLPLDTLDSNIICADALFTDWQKADAIIGNPPFLGGKKLRTELGDEYAEKIYQKFPDVQGQPDFCVFWFRKAAENLGELGRAGLVGTNSISQVSGRKASLDYVVKQGGFIHEAISTQPWSGEANVHVSIVNWSKERPKELFLDNLSVNLLSTALKSEISVDNATKLNVNKNFSFESCGLRGKGFIVTKKQVDQWILEDPKNQEVLKPMIDGKNLIYPWEELDWVIDFQGMNIEEATNYQSPFERVRIAVKPERDKNRRDSRKKHWWRFGEYAPKMRQAISKLSCYFAIPKIAKYIVFSPVDVSILFPFPQKPSRELVEKIRQTAGELHEYRSQQMEKKQWGITKLYNQFFNEPSSQLYQLHQKLNKLVMEAYHFQADDDILEKLLTLNLELAEKEKRGETVIGPWSPYS